MRRNFSPERIPPGFRQVLLFFFCRRFLFATGAAFLVFSVLLYGTALFSEPLGRMPDFCRHGLLFLLALGIPVFFLCMFLSILLSGERLLHGLLSLTSLASQKAFDLASPFLTRAMHAADAETVLNLLSWKIREYATAELLAGACLKNTWGFLFMLGTGVFILFLPVPGGRGCLPSGKMELCRNIVFGTDQLTSQNLEITGIYPGDKLLKRDTPWIVRVGFNRDLQQKLPKEVLLGAELAVPLEKIAPGVYQAIMPPLKDEEASYVIRAENRFSQKFTVKTVQSETPVMDSAFIFADAAKAKRLDTAAFPWTVPEGADLEICLRTERKPESIHLEGSGGLAGDFSCDPATGLWKIRFTVWETGVFSFQWTEIDGTKSVSDIFPVNIQSNHAPDAAILDPAQDLDPIRLSGQGIILSADDDSGIAEMILHVNDLNGKGEELFRLAVPPGKQKPPLKGRIRFPQSVSNRITGTVIAMVAEAKDHSKMQKNAFSPLQFHPVVKISEAELLNSPPLSALFEAWLKNRLNSSMNEKMKKGLTQEKEEEKKNAKDSASSPRRKKSPQKEVKKQKEQKEKEAQKPSPQEDSTSPQSDAESAENASSSAEEQNENGSSPQSGATTTTPGSEPESSPPGADSESRSAAATAERESSSPEEKAPEPQGENQTETTDRPGDSREKTGTPEKNDEKEKKKKKNQSECSGDCNSPSECQGSCSNPQGSKGGGGSSAPAPEGESGDASASASASAGSAPGESEKSSSPSQQEGKGKDSGEQGETPAAPASSGNDGSPAEMKKSNSPAAAEGEGETPSASDPTSSSSREESNSRDRGEDGRAGSRQRSGTAQASGEGSSSASESPSEASSSGASGAQRQDPLKNGEEVRGNNEDEEDSFSPEKQENPSAAVKKPQGGRNSSEVHSAGENSSQGENSQNSASTSPSPAEKNGEGSGKEASSSSSPPSTSSPSSSPDGESSAAASVSSESGDAFQSGLSPVGGPGLRKEEKDAAGDKADGAAFSQELHFTGGIKESFPGSRKEQQPPPRDSISGVNPSAAPFSTRKQRKKEPSEDGEGAMGSARESSRDVIRIGDFELRSMDNFPGEIFPENLFNEELKKYEKIKPRLTRKEQEKADEYFRDLRALLRDDSPETPSRTSP